MLRVGLTGGLASGKSFVANALAEKGCAVMEADALGHQVLLPNGSAYAEVVAQFGDGILTGDGAVDRKRLAAEVFGDPERLALLNSIVHPAVYRKEEELIQALPPDSLVVIVAAILIETGSYKRCDKVILAHCSREQQIARAMHREGAALPDVLARLDRQMPFKEKRPYADYLVDTSGTKEHTLSQTAEVYDCLRCDHARCS